MAADIAAKVHMSSSWRDRRTVTETQGMRVGELHVSNIASMAGRHLPLCVHSNVEIMSVLSAALPEASPLSHPTAPLTAAAVVVMAYACTVFYAVCVYHSTGPCWRRVKQMRAARAEAASRAQAEAVTRPPGEVCMRQACTRADLDQSGAAGRSPCGSSWQLCDRGWVRACLTDTAACRSCPRLLSAVYHGAHHSALPVAAVPPAEGEDEFVDSREATARAYAIKGKAAVQPTGDAYPPAPTPGAQGPPAAAAWVAPEAYMPASVPVPAAPAVPGATSGAYVPPPGYMLVPINMAAAAQATTGAAAQPPHHPGGGSEPV